jgi:hypothetical protein
MHFFSNIFKDNISKVAVVIDDSLLKTFAEVVSGFAGNRWRYVGDFLSYFLLLLLFSWWGPISTATMKVYCTLTPNGVPSFISRGAAHQAA